MGFLQGIIFAHHPSRDRKPRFLEGASHAILGEEKRREMYSVDGVPAASSDAAEDHMTSALHDAPQVPNRPRVAVQGAGCGFATQAGQHDVECLPVFRGKHPGIQDVAGNNIPDGATGSENDFFGSLCGITA